MNFETYQVVLLVFALTLLIPQLIYRRIQRGPKRTYNVNLKGKVVIITGCSAGIGRETAREIARLNATTIMACRSESKTLPILQQIKQETKNDQVYFMKLDLGNFDSVKKFSEEFRSKYDKLDILINNAGVGNQRARLDEEGHDITFKTNHLGHFLLTNQLMDLIIKTKQSRVINVSAKAHEFVKKRVNFQDALNGKINDSFQSYSVSKYSNILFTKELQKRFDEKNLQSKAVSLHPGIIQTELVLKSDMKGVVKAIFSVFSIIFGISFISEPEGAWTTLYTALQPFEELIPAGYYQFNNLSHTSRELIQFNQQVELWDFSEKVTGVKSIL